MELVDIGGGFKLREDAAAAFYKLRKLAAVFGHILVISTAWRSSQYQARLFSRYIKAIAVWKRAHEEWAKTKQGDEPAKPTPVAPPGRSKHELGLAVDIHVAGKPALLEWLRLNAPAFGFHHTVAREPWHLEFVPAKDAA